MDKEYHINADSLLGKVKIINEREGGLYEAFVPLDLISNEDVPVNQEHVNELAQSISNESQDGKTTGQLSPVLLGQIDGKESFPIIDGFHRVPALKSLGRTEVYSTIKPHCTEEEIIDLRIVSAATHKAIKFSRLIDWVKKSWEYTKWHEEITPTQAFRLLFARGKVGTKMGLDPKEVEDIQKWARKKTEGWHVSAQTVYQSLKTAELADPSLVKEARERPSGHRLDAITPAHLKAIVNVLPRQYQLQIEVANGAKKYALTVVETRALAIAISQVDEPAQVKEIIESQTWRKLTPKPVFSSDISYKNVVENNNGHPDLTEQFFEDEMEIARLSIEVAVLSGRYKPNIKTSPDNADLQVDHKSSSIVSPDQENVQVYTFWTQEEINLLITTVERLKPKLLMALSKFRTNSETAEDYYSQFNLKLITLVNRGKFPYKDFENMDALLFKMARFSAIDSLRKRYGRNSTRKLLNSQENPLTEMDNEFYKGSDESGYELVEDEDERQTLMQLFKKNLADFTVEQRRILMLRIFFDLSMDEVAQIINKDSGTVRATFSQSKNKLTRLIGSSNIDN